VTGDPTTPEERWDDHALWWQREFTDGVDPEYTEQILPLVEQNIAPRSTVLDIGTGEGQIARLLTANLGCSVTGIDPSPVQIREAEARGGGVSYLIGSADDLPVPSGSFDSAVACLVFEHIPHMDAALIEVARILKPGGTFLFLLNHPLIQTPNSGLIDDHMVDPPEQYWQIGPYLRESETTEQVELGVFITFFHRPLSRYLNSAFDAGLRLTRMEEPAPPPGFLSRAPEYPAAGDIPRLLFLRFERT
jgi:SAM-dependent methyltransferase